MAAERIGEQFGPYRIEAVIGKGGMGEVWRARDTRLDRDVALKISAHQFSDRFEREARAIAALNHPHVCTLYDVGPNYLVMEYIEGTPLPAPLPVGPALRYADQICDALDAAHRKGIVHRDLKPGNISLTERGIKLLDFGLAQLGSGPDDSTVTQLTRVGAVMGTPAYMAPEQREGRQADARTDIYSFGCILYEMLTGKRPAGRLNQTASTELDRIISKCLEEDPNLRYQHVSEIRTDLRSLQRDTTIPAAVSRAYLPAGKIAATAAVLLVIAATGFLLLPRLLHGKPKLTDKDTIILADFDNKTGDPVFDGTLRQGLAVQLEQSPYLSLISDDRIQRMLSLMSRPADTKLTPEIGGQICERTGSAAVLEGSIAALGSQYVLGLRAKACHGGDILDEEQVQAARKEDVLGALSQAAGKFRTKVGESLATVEKHNTPLPEATTASLEALEAYSHGLKVLSTSGDAAASPFFKRATEIDPQFAAALARLGIGYFDTGDAARAAQTIREAHELGSRASDAERFFIDTEYDLLVTGNLERAQQTCQQWEATYPRDPGVHGFLSAMIYVILGKYPEALDESKKLVAMDPDFAIGYLQLAFNSAFLNRMDESDGALRQAAARKLEIPEFAVQRYLNAFVRADRAGMDREVTLSQGNPETEDWFSIIEGFTLAYSGQRNAANTRSLHGVDIARQASRKDRAALFEAGLAIREALFGYSQEADRLAKDIVSLSDGRDATYGAALAYAFSGDSAAAQHLVTRLAEPFPDDTVVRSNYLPSLRAILIQKTDASKAVALLDAASQYELGTPPSSALGEFGNLYPVYVRGLAELSAHDGAKAAAEFRKIIAHRTIVLNDPIGALAHLQLGRALVIAGDTAGARAAYGDFLTLWQAADPGIPILAQAKAEAAALQ